MPSFSVKLWYNKQRVKKSKNVSLYLQLASGGETEEVPIYLEWPVKYFDWDKRELKQRRKDDPDILDFNLIIENKRKIYWDAAKHFMKMEVDFDLEDILMYTNTYGGLEGFAAYMKMKIRQRLRTTKVKERIKESTGRAHMLSLRWLKSYCPGDCPINKINSAWLEEYEGWLLTKMHPNTVWARIKDVKAYLTIAYEKDKLAVNPDFMRFENPKHESDPSWLDESELSRLLELYKGLPNHSDKQALRAFLFACFTGLRISDLKRFNKDWIQGDEFVFEPQKQRLSTVRKKTLRIPIIPIARSFINTMRAERMVEVSDQKLNDKLKTFATLTGIKKNLTSHVARHTFATQLAISGVPATVIMKLMGHSKIEVTMVYIHIAENIKAKEMMKLQYAFGNPATLPGGQTTQNLLTF